MISHDSDDTHTLPGDGCEKGFLDIINKCDKTHSGWLKDKLGKDSPFILEYVPCRLPVASTSGLTYLRITVSTGQCVSPSIDVTMLSEYQWY